MSPSPERIRARRLSLLLVAAAGVLILGGCATTAGRAVPGWVLQPPESNSQHEYFVATATSRTGDIEEAETTAAAALLTQINQALGVDVSVLTTGEARSSLDEYRAELVQQVTQSGSGRVEGLRIADRYLVTNEQMVTVHLLGEYDTAAFEVEQAKRRRLLAEREALLLEPERRADLAAANGDISGALLLYAQSASAAAVAQSEGLRIAPAVLQRTLQAANELVAGVRLEAISGPSQPISGARPNEPIVFLITDSTGAPVAGAEIEISYVQRSGGRSTVRTQTAVSDSAGMVRFAYPVITSVGDHSVTARLDTTQVLSLLDRIERNSSEQADALEAALANIRAAYGFVSVSRAREIPTAVLVVDTDASGVPMPEHRTADGIREMLAQAGFSLSTAQVDHGSLAGRTAPELGEYLRSVVPPSIDRAVVGTAAITSFNGTDGYLVQVQATLFAIDLTSGEVIHSVSGVKNAQSASSAGAINSAFLSLGRSLGEQLVSTMP